MLLQKYPFKILKSRHAALLRGDGAVALTTHLIIVYMTDQVPNEKKINTALTHLNRENYPYALIV